MCVYLYVLSYLFRWKRLGSALGFWGMFQAWVDCQMKTITTASAVDCVSQCALTVSISVSVFVCVRTGSALSLLYGTSATLEHHHFNHAVMILQSEVNDVPISAVMQSPWPCSQYANGFLCWCSFPKIPTASNVWFDPIHDLPFTTCAFVLGFV